MSSVSVSLIAFFPEGSLVNFHVGCFSSGLPLTFKLIKEALDECIGNEEHVKAIIKVIKNKRETKYSYDIKRTYA